MQRAFVVEEREIMKLPPRMSFEFPIVLEALAIMLCDGVEGEELSTYRALALALAV